MSFYRTFIATLAAAGLASAGWAAVTTDAAKQQDPAVKTVKASKKSASPESLAEKVNLNKATVKELEEVKGLNPNKARSIVSYRKKNGDFKSVDDLKQVKGFKRMNEKTLKDIQDRLTVG